MQKVKATIVSSDQSWAEATLARLAEADDLELRHVPTLGADMSAFAAERAHVVAYDLDNAMAKGTMDAELANLSQLARNPALPALLLIATSPSVDLYRSATKVGARALIDKAGTLQELTEAIYLATAERAGTTVPVAEEAPVGQVAPEAPQTIIVFGLRGGSGRTSLAVNLALALQQRRGNVALLDCNFAFGAANLMLDQAGGHSFSDLLADMARLDVDLLSGYMAHHPSGLHVLPTPSRPEVAEYVTADHVQLLHLTAREGYRTVVVDAPGAFDAMLFPLLDRCDRLLLVTTGDLASMRNTRAALAVLDSVRFPRTKLRLVLSGVGRPQDIRPKDVASTLGVDIWAQLPWDEAVTVAAINRGVPAVTGSPRSKYAQAVMQIVARLDAERRKDVTPQRVEKAVRRAHSRAARNQAKGGAQRVDTPSS